MFEYTLKWQDWLARAWEFVTEHGTIKTPIFMPVWTQATVKWLTKEQIKEIGSQIILSNTYHLYLRPGADLIDSFGWLHKFMNIDLPILTDSGWFQVFSLGQTASTWFKNKEKLVKITEDWVWFRSHRDWSKHFFNAENVMEIESKLWADIIMAFDECAAWTSSHSYATRAMYRTHRWAIRSLEAWQKNEIKRAERWLYKQALFPIIQWVTYDDLRVESTKFMADLPTPWIAIGWLSVWETKEEMLHVLDVINPHLPTNKPRYLMWVWTPEDLIEAIYRWVDMFDCVLPTRLGRHWVAFSSFGNLKMTNEKYRETQTWIPMKPWFETYVSKNYSLGYLRHLFWVSEILAWQLVSMHNLEYLIKISQAAREAILEWKYSEFRDEFWKEYVVKNKIVSN